MSVLETHQRHDPTSPDARAMVARCDAMAARARAEDPFGITDLAAVATWAGAYDDRDAAHAAARTIADEQAAPAATAAWGDWYLVWELGAGDG